MWEREVCVVSFVHNDMLTTVTLFQDGLMYGVAMILSITKFLMMKSHGVPDDEGALVLSHYHLHNHKGCCKLYYHILLLFSGEKLWIDVI